MGNKIKDYLDTMIKAKYNSDRVVVEVDENDGDYNIRETKLGFKKDKVIESSIILKTFYGRTYDLSEGVINDSIKSYLETIDSKEEYARKESIFKDMIPFEYVDVSSEGHSLESITVYYEGQRYEVQEVSYSIIDDILNKWLDQIK